MDFRHLLASVLFIALIPACVLAATEDCPELEKVQPCACDNATGNGLTEVTCSYMNDPETIKEVLRRTKDDPFKYLVVDASNLPYISAEYFQIKEIERLTVLNSGLQKLFDEAPNAEYLLAIILSSLNLHEPIARNALSRMPTLRNLTIDQVKLQNTEFFEEAPSALMHIRVNQASINSLPERAFGRMSELIEALFENGQISEVKRSFFSTPSKLEDMSFANQILESIPQDFFKDMPNIRNVNLSGNRLSQMPESTFSEALKQDSLAKMDLSGNPLKCNCDMKWFGKLDHVIREKVVGTCKGPKNLNGRQLKDFTVHDIPDC